MDMLNLTFINLFLVLALLSVFYFVFSYNPIESVLWLMLTLFAISLVAYNLHISFFSLILIILYVSAVAVLFIYIVLMLPSYNIKTNNDFFFIIFFCFGLFCFFLSKSSFVLFNFDYLINYFFLENNFVFLKTAYFNQIAMIGLFLYSLSYLPFILLTFIFFVVLLGILLLVS